MGLSTTRNHLYLARSPSKREAGGFGKMLFLEGRTSVNEKCCALTIVGRMMWNFLKIRVDTNIMKKK